MLPRIIEYNSDKHKEMIALRNKILREPLGIEFTQKDLELEAADILCVIEENDRIIGCFILTEINSTVIRLRQMAVDNDFQRKGIGRKLLHFARETAKSRNYKLITLHARKEAENFYSKNGYRTFGKGFIEINIPHIEMRKEV